MTGGGWRLLGTVPLVLSDWIIVSTSVLLLLAMLFGALSRESALRAILRAARGNLGAEY